MEVNILKRFNHTDSIQDLEQILRTATLEREMSPPKDSPKCSGCCENLSDFISHIIFVGTCLTNFAIGVLLIIISILQTCEINEFVFYIQILGGLMGLKAIVLASVIIFILVTKPSDNKGLFWISVLFACGIIFSLAQIGVMVKTSMVVFGKCM